MIEKCIGIRRARQIHRIIRHSKITLLCLLLTIIVLRGTIGAGKFGTPKQDFLVLRNRFASRKFHYRALQDRRLRDANNLDDNGIKFALSSRLLPTLSHNNDLLWDDARLELMKKHGVVRGRSDKPKVLLVTGFSRKECPDFLIKNKIDYCRLHEIGLFYNVTLLEAEMLGFRAKLELIRGILLDNHEVDFVWWMDSDVVFTDNAVELPWERYNGYNLVVHGVNETVFDEENWIGLNFGSFLIRNCQWSLDMIESWSKMSMSGMVRDELEGRTGFEADDQSSTVYLLAKEKDNWGHKVYLENEYCFYAFRETSVERREKRSFGDRRLPMVLHFVGCKPCAKVGDYSNERCLKQVERALDFGGNSISSYSRTRVEKLDGDVLNQVQEILHDERGTKAVKVS